MNKYWFTLLVAAFLEVFWVIGLAYSYNFWTWTATVILILVSNFLMIVVAQILPATTVYAVFVGLGASGTVVAEVLFFGEPFRWAKVILITTLLSGVVGLKLVTDNESNKVTVKKDVMLHDAKVNYKY